MKIEPTEARCHIMTRSFGNGYGDEIMVREDAEEAVNIAFREGQSSPKIKQLEWEESGGEYWEAITPIGTYSITFDSEFYVALYDMDNDVDGEWESLAKAKKACNNDFERRVMECIDKQ